LSFAIFSSALSRMAFFRLSLTGSVGSISIAFCENFKARSFWPSVIPNLATVVYDRSPNQERAPRVARERLRPLSWVRCL
jgi:hypothetical protein